MKILRYAALLLALTLSACAQLGIPNISLRATPTITSVSRTPAPTRPLPPTSTATLPVATATPAVPLAETGPWLTYLSASKVGSEVVAANPDGSARTVVGALPDLFAPLFARPTGASATWFSLQNGRDATLIVFQLPAGKAQKSFSLLSNPDLTPDQRQVYTAILNQKTPPSQAWSPSGRYLAFTGAMDGAFTDMYIFDTQDSSLRRLTENIGESYFPNWSPDEQWLLVQEIDQSHPAAPIVQAVYALAPDGSSLKSMYRPASAGEQIFGWTAPGIFIVASLRQAGLVEARRFDIEKRDHARLQYSAQMEQAVLNPASGTMAFTVTPKDKDTPSLPAGLYWSSPSSGPVLVARGKFQRLGWMTGAGRFFAAGAGEVLSFYPGQQKITYSGEDNLPAASADGKWLAFYSAESGSKPGLRLYAPDGKLDRQVIDQPVQEALWRPDSAGLFFVVSGGELYYLPASGGEPRLLGQGVSNLGWVGGQ